MTEKNSGVLTKLAHAGGGRVCVAQAIPVAVLKVQLVSENLTFQVCKISLHPILKLTGFDTATQQYHNHFFITFSTISLFLILLVSYYD